jgi:glyoxylase-like metal-dependent hydrolase (beta-lactamase superfamily II)
MLRKLKSVAGVLMLGLVLGGTAMAAEPKRVISKISGDLYRFQNNFHFSVFLVTDEGVIATDPINADAAGWLKGEIKKRFNKDVRYLIYSHDHSDHISGGEVFADTATVIAHENAKAAIIGEKRPTAVPDVTFSDNMTIELGGKTVELTYVGPGHSNNSIVVNFPAERTLFAVDFVSVNRLPYKTLSDSYFPGLINALKKVEGMDFDILAPGHGSMGNRQDVSAHRQYVEDLYNGVLGNLRAGKTLDQIKTGLLLEKYKDWSQYKDWRVLNIEGVHARIGLHRRAR